MATFDWNKKLEDYLKDIGYYDQYKAAEDYRVNNDPGKYQSAYQTQINSAMGNIANRQPFKYDYNSDALYKQYKDQYTALGKLAMQNTMGQAAALTGGYGNSYAQSVGQQAYQGYMDQLAGKIPELYQLRRSEYDADTANLYKMLAMYQDADQADYGKYRDTVADYQNMLNYYTGRADTAYNRGTDRYNTDYGNAWTKYQSDLAVEQDARDFAESVRQANERLALQREEDAENTRQFNEKMAYQQQQDAIANELAWYKANSGGRSGGSGGSGRYTEDTSDVNTQTVDREQQFRDVAGLKLKNGASVSQIISLAEDYVDNYGLSDEALYSILYELGIDPNEVKKKTGGGVYNAKGKYTTVLPK